MKNINCKISINVKHSAIFLKNLLQSYRESRVILAACFLYSFVAKKSFNPLNKKVGVVKELGRVRQLSWISHSSDCLIYSLVF